MSKPAISIAITESYDARRVLEQNSGAELKSVGGSKGLQEQAWRPVDPKAEGRGETAGGYGEPMMH